MIVDAALVGQARQLGVNHDLGRPNGDMEFVSINSADVVARVEGVRALLKLLVAREEGNTEGAVRDQDVQSATEALVTRLADDEEAVIAALYEDSTALRGALSDGDRFIEAIAPAFSSLTPSRTILRHHLEFLWDQVSTVESGFERKVFERLIFPCLLRTTRRAPFMEEEISVLSNGNLGRLEVLDGLQSEVSESSEDSGENQHNVAVIRSLAGESPCF